MTMGRDFQAAYHVRVGAVRTTVSLDRVLSDLLSLKLGVEPNSPEAHGAVRVWLQEQLDEESDARRVRVSQWLRKRAVEALVERDLANKYDAWMAQA